MLVKKTILRAALVLTSLCVTFVSCKKETQESSPQALILGTWNIKSSGVDANKNDVLEASESDTLDPSEIVQLIFSKNGLGVSRYGRLQIVWKKSVLNGPFPAMRKRCA